VKNIDIFIKNNYRSLISLRRYLHQNPEVGYNEKKTSDYLINIIKSLDMVITQNTDMKFGFYTEIGPKSKNILALRCDLDALPIQDIKSCEYSSKKNNIMHACGHDAHMTILIGLIKYLKHNEANLNGRVRFIFQPAEECSPGGALCMIKGNALDNVSAIIGYHLFPKINAGKIAIKSEYISATVSVIEIELSCDGGHTARPEESVDLILASSILVKRLNEKLRLISTKDSPVLLVFGMINGGKTFNVIPSKVYMKGTLRYVNGDLKNNINKIINDEIRSVKMNTGAKIKFNIPYSSPGIYNDFNLTNLIHKSSKEVIGNSNILNLESASLGGEDFAFYLNYIPGVYFRIGCFDGVATDLHCNYFDIDESCIPIGIKILNQTIKNYNFH
jgi:amidohydrolase